MSEIEQFGWNALTVSFFLAIAVTLMFCYVNWQQACRIWRLKSGFVVAVPIYLYLSAMRLAMIGYGWRSGSLGLTLSGALSVPTTAAMLVGLVMYKTFSRFEKALAVLIAVLSGLTIWVSAFAPVSSVAVVYSLWSIGLMVIVSSQPLEIWRAKSAGAVTFGTVLAPTVSSAVWIAYSVALGDWVLIAVNIPMLLIATVTMMLWYRYRSSSSERQQQ